MKNSNKGITLVSLVITIIVMLILAGVSLSMVTGEGSVISQAIKASEKQEIEANKEKLNISLLGFNSKTVAGNADETFSQFLGKLKDEGEIDEYYFFEGDILIKKGNAFYNVAKNGDKYEVSNSLSNDLSENVSGKSYIVTTDNADEAGNLKFQAGSSYTILDKISASDFNFVIPNANGKEENAVNIYLIEDMTIDNKGYDRSAIELENGAILNLYVSGVVTVNSGYGKDGQAGTATGAKGGPGGFAGIHVPPDATLNLRGDGVVIAYGGDAGDGNLSSGIYGSGGGGGAGAGIGGNGGTGGNANTTENPSNPYNDTDNGKDGGPGEACGKVNIYNTLTVYAYGGAGGSGGKEGSSSGSGGGGYPAAGIGGGGAGGGGGNHCDGAGGYSGGSAQYNQKKGVNGLGGGNVSNKNAASTGGGGYFSDGIGKVNTTHGIGKIGGQGSGACHSNDKWYNDHAGSGGVAGSGGTVTVSTTAKIYAYNGDMITDGNHSNVNAYNHDGSLKGEKLEVVTKLNGEEIVPLPIFMQAGIRRAVYKANFATIKNFSELKNEKILDLEIDPKKVTSYGYGIGSGAGYIEEDNGTYKIDAALN